MKFLYGEFPGQDIGFGRSDAQVPFYTVFPKSGSICFFVIIIDHFLEPWVCFGSFLSNFHFIGLVNDRFRGKRKFERRIEAASNLYREIKLVRNSMTKHHVG